MYSLHGKVVLITGASAGVGGTNAASVTVLPSQ